jgi:hypothetical protein
MKAEWFRPNVRGILLYLAVVLIGWNFMPSPTFTYSLTERTQTVSWPWLGLTATAIFALLFYPLCIWLGTRMPRQGFGRLLTGPLMIVPQGLVVAIAVGMFIYEPPEIHGHLERHIFLQGNTDWGGGCLFAGTVALYVVFGFTSAWYLMLSLNGADIHGFWRTVIRSLWFLKFHVLAFMIGGTANFGYDARVSPNDFRNIFLFAGMIYLLSVLFIAALHATRLGPHDQIEDCLSLHHLGYHMNSGTHLERSRYFLDAHAMAADGDRRYAPDRRGRLAMRRAERREVMFAEQALRRLVHRGRIDWTSDPA